MKKFEYVRLSESAYQNNNKNRSHAFKHRVGAATARAAQPSPRYLPILCALYCIYPTAAMAADTCVNVAPHTIQCDDDQYTDSIIYNITEDLTLNVDSPATINSTSDNPGIAVYGQSLGNPAANIHINAKGVTINTQGDPSDGILISQGTSGDLSILADSVTINTTHSGAGSNAVGTGITASIAEGFGNGDIYINAINSSITTDGKSSYGLYGLHSGFGNVTVTTSSQITTYGLLSDGATAYIENPNSTGNAAVQQLGGEITTWIKAHGISTYTEGLGSNLAMAAGAITTHGDDSAAVRVFSTNAANTAGVTARLAGTARLQTSGLNSNGISVQHSGSGLITVEGAAGSTIATNGVQGHGIKALATAGGINIYTSGTSISTSGAGAIGILATPDGLDNAAAIDIVADAITTSGLGAHGIVAGTLDTGAGTDVFDTTQIATARAIHTSGERAVGVIAVSANNTTVSADTHISATGEFGAGIMATSTAGTTTVNIAHGATITGGWQAVPGDTSTGRFDAPSAGVILGGTTAQLNNYGYISALSDRAIVSSGVFVPAAGSTTIDNYGTITGYLSLAGGGLNTFNNHSPNSLVMRNFSDTDGDGIRDTKGVVVNDFGGPNAVFNNTSNGAVRFADVTNAAFTDLTGFYQPKTGVDERVLNPGFYDLTREGVVQGQLVNLSLFNNAGVIDLRGPALGNTLLITDQAPANAAVTGTGTFVSNGGSLRLNSAIQAGLEAGGVLGSESDMLIVDRTQLGSGATRIEVSKAPTSLGALTTGNGIELVEVRDAAHSVDGAFTLGHRVAAGAYEYTLHKGGTDLDAADGNWYLRSFAAADPAAPDYRQEVPLNMAVPALANRLGLSLLGTYHDRQGQDSFVSFGTADSTDKRDTSWGRIIAAQGHANTRTNARQHAEPNPSYDFTLGGFQVGHDFYRSKSKNGENFDQAGAYLGIAHIDADVDDFTGARAGRARLTGYSLGGYWTRIGESGGYIDAVGQLTYYGDANTRSRSGESSRTDGWGLTASIETGYPFDLGNNWSLEPQAQLIAQHLKLNGTSDSFGRIESDGATSVTGRLGARLTKQWETNSGRPMTAWARANIWHTFDSNVDTRFSNLNGQHAVVLQTNLGSTVGQVGLGISGEVSKNTYVFATVNYDHALRNDSGKSVSGQVGVKFQW